MKSGASFKSSLSKVKDYSILGEISGFFLGQQVIENPQYFGEITEIRSNGDIAIKMKSGVSFKTNVNKIKDYSILNELNGFYFGQRVMESSEYFGELNEIRCNGDIIIRMDNGSLIKSKITTIKAYDPLETISKDNSEIFENIPTPIFNEYGYLNKFNKETFKKLKKWRISQADLNSAIDDAVLEAQSSSDVRKKIVEFALKKDPRRHWRFSKTNRLLSERAKTILSKVYGKVEEPPAQVFKLRVSVVNASDYRGAKTYVITEEDPLIQAELEQLQLLENCEESLLKK